MYLPIIVTDKFTLRLLKKSDLNDLVKNIGDENVSKLTLGIPYLYTLEIGQNFLAKEIENQKSETHIDYKWAIEIDGEMCGSVSLKLEDADDIRLGYWLAEKHWGKGIMTQAANYLLNFAFNELNIEKVFATVDQKNKGSEKVLLKNGFVQIDVIKAKSKRDGEIYDRALLELKKRRL